MMDWTTISTNMPVIAPIAAGVLTIYTMIKSGFRDIRNDIAKIDAQHREDNILMNANHREDMKSHQADIIRMDEKWERTFNKMDEKWERLFENYLSK